MNRVISILTMRDGNTQAEAVLRVEEVRKMIEDCNYDPDETERILSEQLGLELDYLVDILWDSV